MLARLPSVAVSLARRSSPALLRLPSQVRFNTSEANATQLASEDEVAAPKKRAIPLADSLGDVNISARGSQVERRTKGQNRNGGWNANRNGQQGQRPRRNNFKSGGTQDGDRVNADRKRQSDGQRPSRQIERPASTQSQGSTQPPGQRSQRRSTQFRDTEDEEPIVIPAAREIELGNLDDLFGHSTSTSTTVRVRAPEDGAKHPSPSQDRVQALLERTAGDYSRFVPRFLSTTDVQELSPLELSSFVLSRRRDVGLQLRQKATTIVGKFPGANKTATSQPNTASS
ncbi:hypothetical protein C8Q79DRAFT_922938 [Trametes meyenii]|nr:hypothetical protein C8Q79DRAFT_922938 [Trametes meyenii]